MAHVVVNAAAAWAGSDFVGVKRAAVEAVQQTVHVGVDFRAVAAADAGFGFVRVVWTFVAALGPNVVAVGIGSAVGERALRCAASQFAIDRFDVLTTAIRQAAGFIAIDSDEQAVVGEE